MGIGGNDDAMKYRNINLEPAKPAEEKPEGQKGQEGQEGEDTMAKPAAAHKPQARLGREIQARIGQQLRAMYNEVVNQGVPPHLAELVRRLSEQDQD